MSNEPLEKLPTENEMKMFRNENEKLITKRCSIFKRIYVYVCVCYQFV